MTATHYKGKRLCSCGKRADVVINTGRPDSSQITLLCWPCASGLIGMLQRCFCGVSIPSSTGIEEVSHQEEMVNGDA